MKNGLFALGALLFATAGFADDWADRAKLIGQWRSGTEAENSGETWMLENKGDYDLRITYFKGTVKVAEFDCNTMGKECEIKNGGKKAKVSLYFSGPTLVELETIGNQITKRVFSTDAEGNELKVQLTPLAPAGKDDIQRFKKMPVTAAQP